MSANYIWPRWNDEKNQYDPVPLPGVINYSRLIPALGRSVQNRKNQDGTVRLGVDPSAYDDTVSLFSDQAKKAWELLKQAYMGSETYAPNDEVMTVLRDLGVLETPEVRECNEAIVDALRIGF